jgi:hypothetical protein
MHILSLMFGLGLLNQEWLSLAEEMLTRGSG